VNVVITQDTYDISFRLIDLVNGNYHSDFTPLLLPSHKLDDFECLGHDAVICGDDQDNNVSDGGAARTHGGESSVPRSVEEGNETFVSFSARFGTATHLHGDTKGTNMLGYPARFGGSDSGRTESIEKGCFAVIYVTHDGNDRGAGREGLRVWMGRSDKVH
jgi:hypothetical protein